MTWEDERRLVSEINSLTRLLDEAEAKLARYESRFRPADIIPIQIRENLVVRVHGIPHDLTTAEADKIIGVIRAMATRQDDETGNS